ncbi:MAG: AglZ/HisF2 family acetamidino modification protein [Acidimicrobiia bacterium]
MLAVRLMPSLLLRNAGLVKTIRFKHPSYVGDPVNAIRIFNEKEVDELILLDITATVERKRPQLKIIREIASECFMPLAYGGGIQSIDDIREIFALGIEKVSINSHVIAHPEFISAAADRFGSQSIMVSIDVKYSRWRGYRVRSHSAGKDTGLNPVEWAERVEQAGAGEILLNSIDRDGTMSGYDLDLIRQVTDAVGIPVIACGGAGKLDDFGAAVRAGASAVAAGSMVVYHGRNRAVLINFPTREEQERAFTDS